MSRVDICPRGNCSKIATEIVNNVAYCPHDAEEERRLIKEHPARPNPFGLAGARTALTRYLPRVRLPYATEAEVSVEFNELGEPFRLIVGRRRYRVMAE